MDLEKYLSDEDNSKLLKQKDYAFNEEKLIEKKSMILISVFAGIFGVDRFILGDKIRGILKGTTFVALLAGIMTVVCIIAGKVFDYYSGITGSSMTITWQDNVIIAGQGLANLAYSLIALLVIYIVFAIVDGVLCYQKNMKINYKLLQSQLNNN